MRPRAGWLQGHPQAVLAGVDGELPLIPEKFAAHRSRNNQILLAALAQLQPQVDDAIAKYGRERIAIVLGTSTSGLHEGDTHVNLRTHGLPSTTWHYAQQELGDPSRFLSHWLALDGPAYTLSTACSSSARAMISGRRLIETGLVDAAIVGGADTLSRMPINGFHSLESLSPTLCQPFGRDRAGITIGEGAGLMLLTREPQPIALLGVGESSDAYHISAPHPQGEGAIRAINQALTDAQLTPDDVGYINLHGTATQLNDQIESMVVNALFGERVPCSSTKHLTGHTLGAAGITEAAISMLILQRDLPLPAQDFSLSPRDPTLPPCGIIEKPQPLASGDPVNSFAFGGNNASILLGRFREPLFIPGAYLPHDAPMLLLEDVVSVSDDSAVCRVTVSPSGVLAPFLDPDGNLPGWFALELMAQTVGVWSGWHRHQQGKNSIELGMILGARELLCAAGILPAGQTLTITVKLLMQDDRFGSFECSINDGEATGRINTFQPTAEELTTLFQQGAS